MTREEEIHKAAEKFAFSDKTETPDFYDVINDFYYGAKWADKTMIDKACKWLNINFPTIDSIGYWYKESFIKQFKKAMEE